MEGCLKTATWRARSKAERLVTAEQLSNEIKCWAHREVGRRLLFCPLLSSMLYPGLVAETKDYLVAWVVQAVVIGPLIGGLSTGGN